MNKTEIKLLVRIAFKTFLVVLFMLIMFPDISNLKILLSSFILSFAINWENVFPND